jgi:chemotaxis protein MotB
MFNKKDSDNSSNFWISYADLMAGLLFVFILLIGAIVSKSMILKSNLHDKEDKLTQISQTLESKEKNLESLKLSLANTKSEIEEKKKLITSKDKNLLETQETLKLRKDEIDKLNKMLLAANTQQDLLNNKIVLVQNLLSDSKKEKETFKKQLKDYKGKVIVLSDQISDVNKTVQYKDKELLKLLNALDEKETKYDSLIEKLQSQKAKIKSLTGIKIKVVAALKEELGDKVAIDKNSGSLRISSNILFDKGSANLKPGAKVELKQVFEEYIGTLVTNPKIKPHLDKIIVEGHTDSDGGYLYNLDLSQKRAFVVMNYLLSLDFAKENNIKPLMIASGRAYLDAIKVDGIEDKDASRRIEIKFRLKNEDAMHEIEKVLDAK